MKMDYEELFYSILIAQFMIVASIVVALFAWG